MYRFFFCLILFRYFKFCLHYHATNEKYILRIHFYIPYILHTIYFKNTFLQKYSVHYVDRQSIINTEICVIIWIIISKVKNKDDFHVFDEIWMMRREGSTSDQFFEKSWKYPFHHIYISKAIEIYTPLHFFVEHTFSHYM